MAVALPPLLQSYSNSPLHSCYSKHQFFLGQTESYKNTEQVPVQSQADKKNDQISIDLKK